MDNDNIINEQKKHNLKKVFKINLDELIHFTFEEFLILNFKTFEDIDVIDLNNSLLDVIRKTSDKKNISQRDISIFLERFNGNERNFITLQKIGDNYELSKERIRQIYNKVKKKIKREVIKSLYYSDSMNLCFFEEKTHLNAWEFIYIFNKFHNYFSIDKGFEILNMLFNFENTDQLLNWIKNNFIKEKSDFIKRLEKSNRRDLEIEKFDNWLVSNITFTKNKNVESTGFFSSLKIKRHVNIDNQTSGTFFCEKMNQIIEYESGLEYRLLSKISQSKYVKEYKVQSLKIEYLLEDKKHNYYPDIQILTINNEIIIVECKPFLRMMTYENIIKYNALIDYCNKMGFGYAYIDERTSFPKYLSENDNGVFLPELLRELSKNKVLYYFQVKKILYKYGCTSKNLNVAIYRNNIKLKTEPFFMLYI